MRTRERGDVLELDDTPGLHWFLGLLFVGVGGLFVAGPLGLFHDANRLRWWLRALSMALGALGVVAGVWTLGRAPRSRLTVDPRAARLRLVRWGLGGHEVRDWPLAALAGVRLAESRDDEGGVVFRLELLLREAPPVPVSPVWRHGRVGMAAVARRLAAAAGVRTVNVEPLLPTGPLG